MQTDMTVQARRRLRWILFLLLLLAGVLIFQGGCKSTQETQDDFPYPGKLKRNSGEEVQPATWTNQPSPRAQACVQHELISSDLVYRIPPCTCGGCQ